jgi:uncharacterized protein (DUF433 family)
VVDIINIDKNILGGKVFFNGTRVPVESLYDHLNEGVLLNDFLEDFPFVSKYQALALLN